MGSIAIAGARSRVGNGSQRAFDLAIAVPLLALTSPLLVLAALAIRLDSRGPALFRQPRTGRDRQDFTIIKLRTMFVGNDDSEARRQNVAEFHGQAQCLDGVAFKDERDPRITRVGRLLRRFSIDELPQLWNVVRGDMSIVGPRPPLVWEAALFGPATDDRFLVRPGITGVWQVSGRNNVSMPEMLEMDCEYARTRTVLGDVGLVLRTIPAVLDPKGAA